MRLVLLTVCLIFSLNAFAQLESGGQSGHDRHHAKTVYDPTDDLLAAFKGGCSSIGAHTSDALAQTAALKRVVEGMKNDPNCDHLHGALTGYQSAHQQMHGLLANGGNWKRNRKEASVNQLLAAVTVEEDPSVKELLRSELAHQKVELVNLGYENNLERREMMYRSAANFVQYSELALGALGTESACLEKRPGLGIQLAGQIMAASSGFMSGPLGPAFFSLGSAVNSLVRYFSERKHNKLIKKTVVTRLGPALGCAMESLAASYCQARDSSMLVNANANSEEMSIKNKNWQGLLLLSRDIRKYNAWVTRVVAGAPPTNKAAASLKSRGNLLEAALRVATDRFRSILVETANKEKLANDDTQKTNIRRQAIKELVGVTNGYLLEAGSGSMSYSTSSGMSADSPFYQTFSYDTTCGPINYLITGQHKSNVGPGGVCKVESDENTKIPDLLTITQYIDQLIVDAGKSVANEVALVRENDFLGVLAKAELTGNNLLEATGFLQKTFNFLVFLEEDRTRTAPRNISALISDTRAQIEKAAEVLNARTEAKEKVALLQEILAPKLDIYFLSNRLTDIIQWDLNDKLKSGKIKEAVALIYQDSLRDNLSLAEEIGVFNLNAQAKDTATARTLTIQNMGLVVEIFHDQLGKYLEDLQDQRKRIKDPVFEESLNIFCLQASLIPDQALAEKELKLRTHCAGRAQRVVYRKLNYELRFDEQAKKDFSKRVCAIYDMERKSRIFGLSR